MDRDGAFAVTVSSIEEDTGTYSDTHRLLVFQNPLDGSYDEIATTVCSIIVKAMDELGTKTI
ncbi:MAG: hypothetical protein IJI83_02545 [Oscillospiraceae bacterium]|nr:hypothetical protein [Oscillospiraceae bacterium]